MITRRQIVLAGRSLAAAVPSPAQPNSWPGDSPESQGMRGSAVAETLDADDKLPGLRTLLVARNGELVAERYYGGATAARVQPHGK